MPILRELLRVFAACLLVGGGKGLMQPSAPVPSWTATAPNFTKPLGGFKLVNASARIEVYHGGIAHGTYNHAAMLDYFNGSFLLAWKNGASDEDKDGQRILFSHSDDGVTWTPTDGTNVLFPALSTTSQQCAMFVGPPAHINGRLYAAASPGIPTDAAAGAQWCLWPDPVSPRNCGPPGHSQTADTLLMRQVLGRKSFGPMFWASPTAPSLWADATKLYGIKTLAEMDAQTQGDVALLRSDLPTLPCPDPTTSGSLKCEACLGGCQLWDDIHVTPPPSAAFMASNPGSAVGNERTHYVVPNSPDERETPDVILYRSGEVPFLYASVRPAGQATQTAWPEPVLTNIPNDESNLNSGPLPDGRVYLVNNPVFEPKSMAHHLRGDVSAGTLRFRDPVVVATSATGYEFDTALAVITCTQLPNNSTCQPRYAGGGKNPGPSYPQGLAVVAPAPEAVRGFYVVATNNKEDVWITKIDFGSF